MRLKRTFAIFLVLGIVTCIAQNQREKKPLCDSQGKGVDITDGDATILGFAIGRSSLQDVQAKLGNAPTERVSREEESDIVICYVSPTDGTVFAVYSGAMGGWKDITWFALWSGEAPFPNRSNCTTSSKVSQNLATASGLRLELTAEELKRIAGTPSKVSGSSIKYDYVCRRKMTQDEISGFKVSNNWDVTNDPYFDRMSWIDVHLKDARASRVEIGRIESY
jgi:hypothetical protein